MASELFAVLVLAASVAAAEPTAADRARAKTEFVNAQKAYDVGDFKVALAGYTEAYRLDPRPPFLFNIAQCHRQLNDPERAVFFYSRFLSHYGPGKAPNDATAHDLLTESEAKLAAQRAAATAAPADAPVVTPPIALTPFPPPPSVPAPEPDVRHSDSDGVLHQWWFWTVVGVVAAGALIAVALVVSEPKVHARTTTLPDESFR